MPSGYCRWPCRQGDRRPAGSCRAAARCGSSRPSGPASNTPEMIRRLAEAGADAFRINMSHGTHADHARADRSDPRRSRRSSTGRPRSSPTCRARSSGSARSRATRPSSKTGQTFVFDRDEAPGDATRVDLPHREIFEAVEPGTRLLVDDGKLVLRVDRGRRRTGSRPGSRSAARSRTTRASTSPTWCCRSRR